MLVSGHETTGSVLTWIAYLLSKEAIKCMHHSKRTMLTIDDVDSALNLRNVELIYGFASGDPLRFRRTAGHKDLFYIDDKDLDFKDLYFDKITEVAVTRSDSVRFKEALESLATDFGLHPLVPYFTYFIVYEVSYGLNNFRLLFALMRLVGSLLQDPHIHIEPYLDLYLLSQKWKELVEKARAKQLQPHEDFKH